MARNEARVATPTVGLAGRQLGGYLYSLLRFCRRRQLGALGLFIVVVVVVVGAFAGFGNAHIIAQQDPYVQDYTVRLQGPSLSHWLGTDEFGRDLYSRVVYGARISLIVAFWAVGIGTTIGFLLGIVSGYLGGWIDAVLQRVSEIIFSFPAILLAMALVAVLGSGLDKVIIALSVVFTPIALRTIRGTVLSVKQNVYIEAARSVGAGPIRIMFRHILPNVTATYLIIASVQLGSAILIEATLSFLGVGVPPPHPSWGRMLSGGAQSYVMVAPWLVIFPGMAITLLVLGFNLFGDALRDIWDPKLRGR